MNLYLILMIMLTVIISYIYIPIILLMLKEAGCVLENYKNKLIPSIGGIVFIPILLTSICVLMLKGAIQHREYIRFLFIICSMGIMGLLDDLIGVKHIKGIRNHTASLFKGTLTTGFMKAFNAGLIALIICLSAFEGVFDAIINFFVIVLFTNTLNLLDLRPGRSTKAFISIALILVIFSIREIPRIMPLIMIVSASVVYLFFDLNEKCMLGDTGSNIFGITLGYYSSILLNIDVKTAILGVLLFINILSEKRSLTEIISKNKILSFFDNLGRG